MFLLACVWVFDGVIDVGGCAGDLWPFVTLSEWEERGRDAESERERFLNSA